jgi:hypothetical protein
MSRSTPHTKDVFLHSVSFSLNINKTLNLSMFVSTFPLMSFESIDRIWD